MEGIIAKPKDSIYRPGKRTSDWLKIKARLQQEFVVSGFTAPKGSRKHLGADRDRLRIATDASLFFCSDFSGERFETRVELIGDYHPREASWKKNDGYPVKR